MSTSKRPRTSRPAGVQRSPSPAEPPASKRRKPSHVPEKPSALDFLVDENKRAGTTVKAKLTNGVSRNGIHVDKSHAVLAQDSTTNAKSKSKKKRVEDLAPPQEVIAISSGEEESSVLDEDDDEDDVDAQTDAMTNGHSYVSQGLLQQEQAEGSADDEEMKDSEEAAGGASEPASFGELLQARHPAPIDVRRTLQEANAESHGLVPGPDDAIIPSGHSLRTALSQALKNNDKDLLESCFSVTNPTSIRVTIQRLKSHDVATLLERIAERIYRSPGRTGPLMVWVQWALVDHGGYLANQPELMLKLKKLSQVVRERATGLLPLLHLKGKLDLLCAQLQHRRDLQATSRAVNLEDPDDDREVLYVEGQDDDGSEDSDDGAAAGQIFNRRNQPEESADEDESEDEDIVGLTNGIAHDDEEGESASEDENNEDMLDIEAEEASEDDDDDEEADSPSEDEDDDDNASGESSGDEIEVAQPKLNALNRKR